MVDFIIPTIYIRTKRQSSLTRVEIEIIYRSKFEDGFKINKRSSTYQGIGKET